MKDRISTALATHALTAGSQVVLRGEPLFRVAAACEAELRLTALGQLLANMDQAAPVHAFFDVIKDLDAPGLVIDPLVGALASAGIVAHVAPAERHVGFIRTQAHPVAGMARPRTQREGELGDRAGCYSQSFHTL